MNIKKIPSLLILCLSLGLPIVVPFLLFDGCATKLDPAGVYQGNQFLFTVDKTLVDSKDTLNTFVTWEYQNHATLLATAPGVINSANLIRREAPIWFTNAYVLRSNYVFFLANAPAQVPTASNNLNSAVSLLSAQAMAVDTLKGNSK